MKKIIVLLVVLGFNYSIWAQTSTTASSQNGQQHPSQSDSGKTQLKKVRTAILLKLHWANGYSLMKRGNSLLDMKSGLGSGAELQIGLKLHKYVSLSFGINLLDYAFDQKRLDNSLMSLSINQPYTSMLVASRESTLTKAGLFICSSYWVYRPKNVFEFYAKLSLTNTHILVDDLIYKRSPDNHYSEYLSYKGNNNMPGCMPSLGLTYSLKIWNLMYFTLSGEYGYNITSKNMITETRHTSYGEEFQQKIVAPSPTHFLQLNAGLMLRPFNRVRSSEKEYQEPLFGELNQKNN